MSERIRVFCSHNSVDKPRVKAVAERLAAAGIDPWVDAWEIAPGDDIVAKIDRGLAQCQVGLIFFSKTTLEKPWVRNEVSALAYQSIEDGKAVIPVMLDPDAPVPELLRPRARVAGDDLDRLIDAIYGRSGKPRLAPPRTQARDRLLRIRLEQAEDDALQISAELDGEARASEPSRLAPALRLSYRRFLDASFPGLSRGSFQEAAAQRDRDLIRLGDSLGQAILPGAVGQALAAALDGAAAVGGGLRIELESGPDLLALPFEAARLPDGRTPALDPGVRLLRRQIGLASDPPDPLPAPLRILVAVGAPDEGNTRNAVLDYESELSTILDAIDGARRYGNAEVKILEVGHPDQIRRALLARAYHVLHISGHGSAGVIELEDEDGLPVRVTPAELAAALRAAGRRPPLVFLASCLSGAGDSDGRGSETGGFAQGLLAQGIPLVLAMQASVSDWYATRLAGAFYRELSTGETPLASRALANARREVERERREALARGERHPGLVPEYATPTLFAGAEERPLVDYGLPKEEPAPHPALPPVGRMPLLEMDELVGRRVPLRQVTGILRDDPRVVGQLGRRAGVLVTGIGGVGKSALAGRVMARLAEDGWTVCVAVGRLGLGELALTLGGQLCLHEGKLGEIGTRLLRPELPDQARLAQLQALLSGQRLLLVLDNFEDNLSLGGEGFLDDGTAWLLGTLLQSARTGKVLITCRYPVPDTQDWLAEVPLGPLSPAETRKLFYRLPALEGEAPETLGLILRHVGGHPRMLEYLDAILRQGVARLPAVTAGLREKARKLGLDPRQLGGDLDTAMRDALRLGAEDVLLGQLLDLIGREPADLAVLHQAAAFAVPVDVHGLAFALAYGQPTAEQISAVESSARRLIGTSLLTPTDQDRLWVHRWTAEEIRARMDSAEARECSRRAGEYHAWRVEHVSHDPADGFEATRCFLEARAFDRAVEMAEPLLVGMRLYGQQLDVATFAAEVLAALPADHPRYYYVGYAEANAQMTLGATERALARFRETNVVFEYLARAEPGRADYQRVLSVSYIKMGDIYWALGQGEAAHGAFQRALDIVERQARAEPGRADYQRDLSISYGRMGDLYQALGRGEAAREAFQKSLDIAERLARAEPGRTDYQRDLLASYIHMGGLDQALGQGEAAREAFQRSLDIAERLVRAEPERVDYQRGLAACYERMGDLYRALGQGEAAREAFQKDLDIAESLARAEPGRADFQRDLSVSYDRIGNFYWALGQGEAARETFQKALDIAERLARAEPERADYQRDLSLSYNRMGDLYRALGQGEAAREAFQKALDIAERLARAEPGRADFQRDLSVSYERMGDLYRALGQGEAARETFQKSLDIAERLARAEPGRVDYWHDLSISNIKIGDLYWALGQGEAAREAFQKALDIAERLARAEPGRADYQRDLSLSYDRMGDLYQALGQGESAREAFQKSLDIRERLARADPGRADYQRDLSVAYGKMGGLDRALGQGEAAREAFQKSLDIAERLARAEPGRADYQRDLSVSYIKMGDIYWALGQGEAARETFQKALDITERLARAEPGRADFQSDLSVSYERMGDLYQALGQGEAARESFQKSLDIRERLARAEPGRADYQRDLSVSYDRMGDLYRALGQGEAAREAFQKSLDIRERLARAEPGRADYQWDLVVSLWRAADMAEDGGRMPLERALGILRLLDGGGALYPDQRQAISAIDERLRGLH